jgi:hypothetical protein
MPQEKALSFIKTYLIAKISQKCQKFIMKNNSCPLVWPATLSLLRKWGIGGVNLPP